jgi:murein DD-endopeptidase MepM/ murein hydrolase activator NlpD
MTRSSGRRDLFLQVSGNVDPLKASMKAGQSVLAEFGTAAVNVQAEVEKALGNLGANAPAQAKQMERAYQKTFAAIRANAKAVMDATPAGAVEILNVAGARQAAEAAEQQAAALRMVANAAAQADTAANGNNAELRILAFSTEAAAQEAGQYAAALRGQANALSGVEAQIEGVTAAKKRNVAITGQARAGMQQLGFQMNDVAVQFAQGTPPAIIFSQQISQVTQAVQMMGDGTNKVASFLGGPWGIALGFAMTALAPFVGKLFEESDALKAATDELTKNSEKTKIAEQAKDAFAKTIPGIVAAIRKETEELEKQNLTLEENARLRQKRARAEGEAVKTELYGTDGKGGKAKELAAAQRELRAAVTAIDNFEKGDPTSIGPVDAAEQAAQNQRRFDAAQKRVRALEAEVDGLKKDIARAERNARMAGFTAAEQQAKEAVDPIEAIKGKYRRKVDREMDAAAGSDELNNRLVQTLLLLKRQEEAELSLARARQKAAEDRRREAERAAKQGPLTNLLLPVNGPQTGRFGEDRGTHRHQGRDYGVPVGTPVKAPAAGVVTHVGPKGAYGNVIYINFGGGVEGRYAHLSRFDVKPGERVEAGDVIGLSGGAKGAPGSGRSTGAHLHEEIRINGKAVDPAKRKYRVDEGQLADIAAKAETRSANSAEVEAQRELAEDIKFGDEERKLRLRLLDLQGRTADNAAKRLDLAEEEIRVDAEAYAERIGKLKQAGKLDEAEAKRLLALNDEVKAQRERNLKIEEATRVFDQQAGVQSRSLEYDIQMLRMQLDLATTTKERERIARELLAAEQKQRRQALEAAKRRPDATEDDVARADDELKRLPDIETGEREKLRREDKLSPMDEYRKRLEESLADIDGRYEEIGVRAIQNLEDDLAGAAAQALGLKGALGQVAEELIRIGLQKAILAMLNLASGGSGGEEANATAAWQKVKAGSVPGFASGGMIRGPGTGTSDSIPALVGGRRPIAVANGEYLINARSTQEYLPLIEAINAGTLPGFAGGGMPSAGFQVPRLPRLPKDLGRRGDGISISVPMSLHAPGADPAQLARLEAAFMRAQDELPTQIVATVLDARSRLSL